MLRAAPSTPAVAPAVAPFRWLHAMLALVLLNGASQYLGLKTETTFTMYSNLRTEAEPRNHFFMPVWPLTHYTADLVEIVETDNAELQEYIDEKLRMTYFEFHRFASGPADDYRVRYRRNGAEPQEFSKHDGVASDAELARPIPILLAKLLFFRPVSLEECVPCLH